MKKLNFQYDKLREMVTLVYAGLMVSIFPLYLSDGFFNARHDKLNAFYLFSCLFISATAVVYIFFDNRTKEEKLKNKFALDSLSVTDWAMAAFLLSAIIGTCVSDYFFDSLTGTSGRNNSLILIVFYVTVYFIISRSYRANIVVPALLCFTSTAVALLAVLNHFRYDPLNIYSGMSQVQQYVFISTIGNRNILSAFLCLTFPVCFMLSVYSRRISSMVSTAVCATVNFCGIICGNSDGGILGVVLFLALCFIFIIRDINKLARFFALTGVMVLACKLIGVLSYISNDYSRGFNVIQKYFVYGNTYLFAIILVAVAAALYIFSVKKPGFTVPKNIRVLAVCIFALILLAAAGLVVYYSAVDTQSRLTGIMKYFRFDDYWGTHRGFMWIRAMYIYFDLDIIHKLFGTGADTFKNVMDASGYNQELLTFKNETTDCAHNVYLNYLVTLGIAGVSSYITAIISSVIRAVKKASKNKYAVIFAAGVVCYSIQAIVNIDQPITTPLLIILLALAESQNRINHKPALSAEIPADKEQNLSAETQAPSP